MKYLSLILLALLVLGGSAFAQPAPSGLSGSVSETGLVSLNWNAPPLAGMTWAEFLGWPTSPAERATFEHPNRQQARDAWNALNQGGELDEFIHYRVYKDGAIIGTTTEPNYEYQLASPGTYSFTVTAFYDEGESSATGPVTLTWYDPDSWLILEDFNDGMPDTWVIESTLPTQTWHIDNGNEWGHFPTPYALVDSDAPGSCPHLMERLITPVLDFENAEGGELTFQYVFNEYIEEHGYVEVRVGGGAWSEVYDITTSQTTPTELSLDLQDWVVDQEEVEISFYYDDLGNWGWYWGIDDVMIYRDGSVYPVVLDVSPTQTTVPPNGGAVVMDVEIENTLPTPFTGIDAWTMVTTPSGQTLGPLFSMPFPLSPYMLFYYVGFAQQVPAGAPAGTYTYHVHLGYPGGFSLQDSFTFVKLGFATEGEPGWTSPSHWPVEPVTRGGVR